MTLAGNFRTLTTAQRHAFVASWAGWALDAFDFFIFIFALKSIATDFHTTARAGGGFHGVMLKGPSRSKLLAQSSAR